MKLALVLISLLAQLICVYATTGKVVNYGSKLPELIESHPDKSWLIKFYAPWCYHCQQLEPSFINVAEHIYHKHDNLIVGQVDCTKYGETCDKYKIRSYPELVYLNKNIRLTYVGDRSPKSMISFAERLNGPDVRSLALGCNGLKELTDEHGLVVLNVIDDKASSIREAFKSVAVKLKSSFWFYETRINKNCQSYGISEVGLYIIKKRHFKAIKFDNVDQNSLDDSKNSILKWLERNSLPVYGPVSSGNLERVMSLGKPLVVAVLDEYRPAKKFTQNSKDFHQLFGEFVQKFLRQYDDRFTFAWTSDIELVKTLVIGHVFTPNIIILNSNYTYNLLIDDQSDYSDKENVLPKKLEESYLRRLLEASVSNQLTFQGGNSYFRSLLRQLYSNYSAYMNIYRANPLLSSILIGLPSIIMLFVIYTTCFHQSTHTNNRDDEQEESDDEFNDGYDDSDDEQHQRLMKRNKEQKKQD